MVSELGEVTCNGARSCLDARKTGASGPHGLSFVSFRTMAGSIGVGGDLVTFWQTAEKRGRNILGGWHVPSVMVLFPRPPGSPAKRGAMIVAIRFHLHSSQPFCCNIFGSFPRVQIGIPLETTYPSNVLVIFIALSVQ